VPWQDREAQSGAELNSAASDFGIKEEFYFFFIEVEIDTT
jgi:hypothetical protein